MKSQATARTAAWNFSIVGLNKIAQTIGSVAFVLLIPRMLGAEQFGQFAFITSLFIIATRAGDLGMEDVLVRFIPEHLDTDDADAVQQLAGQLLALRLLLGAFFGGAAALWAYLVTDWLTSSQAVLMGLTIWLYVIALLPYEMLLGLGRAGRWAINSSWRQFALILSITLLFQGLHLGFDGVVLALFLTQIFFLGLGLWWTRDFVRVDRLRLKWQDVKPYLMAGGFFFLANVLLAVVHRIGGLAIEVLIHDQAQIGFFELGNSLYLMLFLSITQAMMALLPLASRLHLQGHEAELGRWFALLQRFGVVLAMVLGGWVWGLAPVLVEPVFGPSFQTVAQTMSLGMLALAVMLLGYPAGMLAVVWRQPRIRFWAGLGALGVTLAALSSILVWQANGAIAAMVCGVLAYTLIIWWLVRRRISLAWGKGMLGLVLGGVYLPLLWFDAAAWVERMVSSQLTLNETNSLILAVAASGLATFVLTLVYLGLVFASRVISFHEIRTILKTLRHR